MIRPVIHYSAVLCLTSVPLWASDHYVDVVNGNDTNAGSTSATAWKTLTHASTATPAGSSETIHVAAGTLSPTSGESFPLVFDGQRIIADNGSASTLIDGAAVSVPLFLSRAPTIGAQPIGPSLIQGFTLQHAASALDMSSIMFSSSTAISDCRITEMSVSGISVSNASSYVTQQLTIDLTRVTIDHTVQAFDLVATAGPITATAVDCAFQDCSGSGVRTLSTDTTLLTFTRCRFERDANAGLLLDDQQELTFVRLYDCLLAHDGAGMYGDAHVFSNANLAVQFWRCTIVDNANFGARVLAGPGPNMNAQASFWGTIVEGNNPDLFVSTFQFVGCSWIGLGDPLFVDRVHGDYRLRFDSPCIDQGDPSNTAGAVDLAGAARYVDSDLDTVKIGDVGAFEFQPLALVTSGHIGTPLRLEMAGQTGGMTTVYFSRAMPVSPMSTPFGEFDLNPASFGTLLHSNVAPFPPVAFQRPIPNNPFLVGHTFSFQALTTSSIAPQGSAYTNVVSFTLLP